MVTVTIELPATTHLTNKSGLSERVDWNKVAAYPALCAEIMTRCATVVLMNSYNSGGEKAKPEEKLAQLHKRLDAWYGGSYVVVERESSGEAKTLFIADYADKAGLKSVNVAEKRLTDGVKKYLGVEAKATFENMLRAIGISKGLKDAPLDSFITERVDKYAEIAAKNAAEAAKLDLDFSKVDI